MFEFKIFYAGREWDTASKAVARLEKKIQDIPITALPIIYKEMRAYVNDVIREMKQRHGRPYPSGTTNYSLSKRSGTGVRSWQNRTTLAQEGDEGVIKVKLSKVHYYGYHETGATVRARRKKYLTIPLEAALDDNGVPLYPSLRDWKNTFVRPSKKNSNDLVVYYKFGKKVTPIYLLKREISFRPRLNLRKTMEKKFPSYATKAKKAIAEELSK